MLFTRLRDDKKDKELVLIDWLFFSFSMLSIVQNVIFTVELFRATVKASKFSFAELIKAQASKNNSVFLIENLA